jgi:hypothetical protein
MNDTNVVMVVFDIEMKVSRVFLSAAIFRLGIDNIEYVAYMWLFSGTANVRPEIDGASIIGNDVIDIYVNWLDTMPRIGDTEIRDNLRTFTPRPSCPSSSS